MLDKDESDFLHPFSPAESSSSRYFKIDAEHWILGRVEPPLAMPLWRASLPSHMILDCILSVVVFVGVVG